MPSAALNKWSTFRADVLNDFESARRAVGGSHADPRRAAQQMNQAYAISLSAQFQGFCRDLHDECIAAFLPPKLSVAWSSALGTAASAGRELDKGNPSRESLKRDFKRFGLSFVERVIALNTEQQSRFRSVDKLILWRNAIAHQDFSKPDLGRGTLWLRWVRLWRRDCSRLAESFDAVMEEHLLLLTGRRPW